MRADLANKQLVLLLLVLDALPERRDLAVDGHFLLLPLPRGKLRCRQLLVAPLNLQQRAAPLLQQRLLLRADDVHLTRRLLQRRGSARGFFLLRLELRGVPVIVVTTRKNCYTFHVRERASGLQIQLLLQVEDVGVELLKLIVLLPLGPLHPLHQLLRFVRRTAIERNLTLHFLVVLFHLLQRHV